MAGDFDDDDDEESDDFLSLDELDFSEEEVDLSLEEELSEPELSELDVLEVDELLLELFDASRLSLR